MGGKRINRDCFKEIISCKFFVLILGSDLILVRNKYFSKKYLITSYPKDI